MLSHFFCGSSEVCRFIAKKLCPQLVSVPLNFDKYIKKAEEIRSVLAKADPNYMAASLDEAYLNITDYVKEVGLSPEEAVSELRAEIQQRTGLTVSAGIGPNSRLAKIGSNQDKPNGQFQLPNSRQAIMDFVSNLSVRKVNGIGKVFERQLEAIGVNKCRDIYTNRAILSKLFGEKTFEFLIGVYLGLGSTSIQPAEDHERKSIGTESTFRDMSRPDDLRTKLRYIAEELEKDCVRTNLMATLRDLQYESDVIGSNLAPKVQKAYLRSLYKAAFSAKIHLHRKGSICLWCHSSGQRASPDASPDGPKVDTPCFSDKEGEQLL